MVSNECCKYLSLVMPAPKKLEKVDYQSSSLKFRTIFCMVVKWQKKETFKQDVYGKVTTHFRFHFILFQEYLPAYKVESLGTSELMPFWFVSDLNTSFFSE